jgi:hypothetical protein
MTKVRAEILASIFRGNEQMLIILKLYVKLKVKLYVLVKIFKQLLV